MLRKHFLKSFLAILLLASLFVASNLSAQAPIGSDTHSFKIYHVNYGFYPVVQAYLRTWNENQRPLENVNIANIGLQIKGRNYDPVKAIPQRQYSIETLERRSEGFRTIIILDASLSMNGTPFVDARNAVSAFIDAKRAMDQVAIIALRDKPELISNFENNNTLLHQRLSDIACDGRETHLYDAVADALKLSATTVKGDLVALDYAVLTTIVVLSDGKDEGSSISKDALLNRIGQMPIPVPIHSLAFTKLERQYLLNIEALSRATFGNYWDLPDTKGLARTMQEIHRINRSDFVVTFHSYIPIDGDSHTFRIGLEYPSGSDNFLYSTATFDAIESPAPFNAALNEHYQTLLQKYPALPSPPYYEVPTTSVPSFNNATGMSYDVDDDIDQVEVLSNNSEKVPPVSREKGVGQSTIEWIQDNTLLVAMGAVIIVLTIGLLLLLVKR